MSVQQHVPSPVATGGGGTLFEKHVDAFFLSLLLVRGIPPILKGCLVEEVHLQAGHRGWKTDDLLIIGMRGAGERRQLAIQVKLRLTISSKDEDCRKVITNFWFDFKSDDRFDPTRDRLGLVVFSVTEPLQKLSNLLDCARASTDGADFARRLSVAGLSKSAQDHATEIRTIIEGVEKGTLSDDSFWRFLRLLHVVPLDLNTSTAQSEALIKSLLALTSHEPDPLAAAEATWRELLELVDIGMPTAAGYMYSALPEKLRSRHAAVATENGRALRALVDHSETVLDGIHTTIAHTIKIRRDALVTRLLECLDEHQVNVVTGPAGLGKSALVKNVIELLHDDLFCLAFRAEEFAKSHIDQTLQQTPSSVNAQQLLALLAAQGRKVILVESVERLLEHSVRDAFSDLLRLAQQDRSIKIILTCRDYQLDTVSTSLLEPVGLKSNVLEVPPLTDDEVTQVVQAVPRLKRVMEKSTDLRKLLRSPYLLDKAARMDWSETGTLPKDERTFRVRCWNEVVRRDAVAGNGLPRRREQVFLELALRRARALSPHVLCDDLDAEAVEELRKDDLLTMSKETTSLVAPAHDVLEDWAIIQWLDGRFALHEGRVQDLAADIGGYPAIRRGYRKWLTEMLEFRTEKADSFVPSVVTKGLLPPYFRDDTLICTLLSSSAPDFLTRHQERLLAEQGRLLILLIHLLRVACKTTPYWIKTDTAVPSELLVPKGDAWPTVLQIVSNGLDKLLPANLGLLLGLLEDWVRSINWWNKSDPPGFHAAGKIVFRLLARLDDYWANDLRKQTLKVIANIPRADAAAFENLLNRGCKLDRHDRIAQEFAELLLVGFSASFACRDFPDQIVQLAKAQFCMTDEDLRAYEGQHWSTAVEPYFGIRHSMHFDFFPASALRGLFFPLLRSHPQVGVKFIIDLLNHACKWYGEKRWPENPLEPARRITISMPDGSQITQWTNPRLWCLYRGQSVGPYVLQAALMALESWLLDICQMTGVDIEAWLLKLLKESNNVAITAVVASVCNAYPDKGGRAALVLLGSKELIYMDRARMVQEMSSSIMASLFSLMDAEKQICVEERKKSDSLPHRRHDLEALALKLQLGEQKEGVWHVLDRYRTGLPPIEKQSEEDRLWRLALHRMDIRGFRLMPSPNSRGNDTPSEVGSKKDDHIYFGPGAIEQDIQEIIDRHTPVQAQLEADLSLLNWGRSAWERERSERFDINTWREKLVKARERDGESREYEEYSRGGPGFIAAVCVRDHWDELNLEDRAWCVTKLIDEIERDCDSDDDSIRLARGLLRPDRPAAYVLSRVLSESDPKNCNARILAVLSKALTHSVSEVVTYAAEGVGYYLHGLWLAVAQQYVVALAWQANLIAELRIAEAKKPFQNRLRGYSLIREIVPKVRKRIEKGDFSVETELAQLNLDDWSTHEAAQVILRILVHWTGVPLGKQFYRRIVVALVKAWDADRGDGNRRDRHYEFEHECMRLVARFVLRIQVHDALALCEPLFVATKKHPSDIATFLRYLALEEDRSDGETPFWEIWQGFADRLYDAPWIKNLDSRFGTERELVDILFLGLEWKKGVRHWRRLEGQAGRIDTLVTQLLPSATVLQAYCRFLSEIGERSLPDGFVIVAQRLSSGNYHEMLAAKGTVFYLESLLRRYVYGEPLRLKSNSQVRSAVLQILNALVDVGSSAAFRMRDDFVTPIGSR